MREFINKVIVLWKDERGNGIIRLSAGLIFMTILVLYARGLNNSSSSTTVVKDYLQEYKNKQIYEEVININDIEYNLIKSSSGITFYNDLEKCIVTENISCMENTEYNIYFWNITPTLIYSLIENEETIYVTNFNDKTREKAYQISLSKFLNKFKGIELHDKEVPDSKIDIKITDDNKNVLKVVLDLTSYNKLVNEVEDTYIIKIEY